MEVLWGQLVRLVLTVQECVVAINQIVRILARMFETRQERMVVVQALRFAERALDQTSVAVVELGEVVGISDDVSLDD